MMQVLVISPFVGNLKTGLNSRIYKIIKVFEENGNIVHTITSDFNHGAKKYKNDEPVVNEYRIHVPSYKKNLSLRRIVSHLCFAIRLRKLLNSEFRHVDLIYCSMPTSSAAYVVGRFAKKNKIMFLVDVIDLWPDSLIPLYKTKILQYLMSPWSWLTHKAYKLADYISGESRKYMLIAKNFCGDVPSSYTYLGVNPQLIQRQIMLSRVTLPPPKGLRICYGGSLGNSYDFENVLRAIKYIDEKNINYEMIFVGDGDYRPFIEQYAEKHSLNVRITGRVPYEDFLKYLSLSDIAINSFLPDTKVVHSYKFNDYVATNCFVINSLKGETAELVDSYQIGRNYFGDELREVLLNVCQNWESIKDCQNNCSKLVHDVLDEDTIYPELYRKVKFVKDNHDKGRLHETI